VSIGEIEKKFVFTRSVAAFRNHLKLLAGFPCRAGKPYREIAGHLFNLKLDAHNSPPLILTPRLTSLKSIVLLATETRNKTEPGVNPALSR
jgi:hypothetical protein